MTHLSLIQPRDKWNILKLQYCLHLTSLIRFLEGVVASVGVDRRDCCDKHVQVLLVVCARLDMIVVTALVEKPGCFHRDAWAVQGQALLRKEGADLVVSVGIASEKIVIHPTNEKHE